MGTSLTAHWDVSFDAPSGRDRQGGAYHPYVPDLLVTRPVLLDNELALKASRAEASTRNLLASPDAPCLEGLARFLLRSEAIASSQIEGLQVSPQQVALAELAQGAEHADVRGFSENARLVANNIHTLRLAASDAARCEALTILGIEKLHRSLLPNDRHQGLRTIQNWIGGSAWNPLNARYIPPPHDRVPELMRDLVDYANGAVHAPLVQAGLVHAQFETIHPFADGNGRVGRALIHSVLTRRGLTRAAVLPISLVLLTRSDLYLEGLTAYRYEGEANSATAHRALNDWLAIFLDSVEVAVTQAKTFATTIGQQRDEWAAKYSAWRAAQGKRGQLRSNSAVARLLSLLVEAPLLTIRTAERLLDLTAPPARAALEELAEAGILHRKKLERNTTGYLARDIFDLLSFTERQLASTKWDTRKSAPSRPVPAPRQS